MTKSSDGTPAGEEATRSSPCARPKYASSSVGGSFRPLTGKAGFKLKFKAANTVLGLRKMTLNNMVQDPSMIHETLAYASFRAAGVPASRTGLAYVRLNGEDIGVYLDLENLDDIGLARISAPSMTKPSICTRGSRATTCSVSTEAKAAAFDYDVPAGTATVSPPASFGGEATFHRGPGKATSWYGDLTVDLPGRANVPLTGSGARASLVRAVQNPSHPFRLPY